MAKEQLTPQVLYLDNAKVINRMRKDFKKVTFTNAALTVCQLKAEDMVRAGWDEEQAAYAIQQEIFQGQGDMYHEFWVIYSLASWGECGKIVYNFDPTLVKALQGGMDDLDIPVECFKLLPVKTFYVQSEGSGFFFSADHAEERGVQKEFFTILMTYGGKIGPLTSLYYDVGDKISDAVKRVSIDGSSDGEAVSRVANILQLVMYLATVNAEVTTQSERPTGSDKIARQVRRAKKAGDTRPVVYHVGTAFGKRYQQASVNPESVGTGSKKRPHIRRSHFHHYWVGSGEDKKLIVKWVSSVFVNADKGTDEIAPTVKDVKP